MDDFAAVPELGRHVRRKHFRIRPGHVGIDAREILQLGQHVVECDESGFAVVRMDEGEVGSWRQHFATQLDFVDHHIHPPVAP